jgi:thioredoxin reductase (NADPH)
LKKSTIEDVIIIGAGPAGMSCAVQLKRCGIKSLVLDKYNKGGLLKYANLIENYPGFPGGIKGTDLVKKFREQFKREKLSCLVQEVVDLKYRRGLFEVKTVKDSYRAKYLVIACGTKPKRFRGFDIDESVSGQVFYGISGLTNKKNRKIVIIGAGDLAFDYALNLGKMNEVTILNRSATLRCIPLLHERAGKLKNFRYYGNAPLLKAERYGRGKLRISYTTGQGHDFLIADYLVFAIGREPALDLIDDEFKKEIKLLKRTGRLHIIGDAANKLYRQTAIASGDGIKAAMRIYEKKREIK